MSLMNVFNIPPQDVRSLAAIMVSRSWGKFEFKSLQIYSKFTLYTHLILYILNFYRFIYLHLLLYTLLLYNILSSLNVYSIFFLCILVSSYILMSLIYTQLILFTHVSFYILLSLIKFIIYRWFQGICT